VVSDTRLERPDLKPERPEMPVKGRGTNKQKEKQNKVLLFYRSSYLLGLLQKNKTMVPVKK